MKQRNPIRIALVVAALESESEDFVKTIDSIRQQTLIPWFVRILDLGEWTYYYHNASEAIDNLMMFCPNVEVIDVPQDVHDGYGLALKSLTKKDYDVLVNVTEPLQLEKNALYDLTEPFYDPEIFLMKGRAKHIVVGGPKYLRRMKQVLLRKGLNAYRKNIVDKYSHDIHGL